jgi:hypothetical protein
MLGRSLAAALVLASSSCGGGFAAPPGAGAPAGAAGVVAAASESLDQAKCKDSKARLRPFIINWDATEQAEFGGQTKQSIAVVKVDGCSLELLTQCRVEGEYRVTETAGNLQALSLENQDRLYAEMPLSVASLSAQLKRSGSLTLKYYVRGMGYATSPNLYRSQLGAGCEGATHFVINYAAGAYELGASSATGAAAGAKAFGAGAGGSTESSTDALFRGGDFKACDGAGSACGAPIRLRLVPIADGNPPEELAAASALAAKKPALDPHAPPRSPKEIQASVRLTFNSLKACYSSELGISPDTNGLLMVEFVIAQDGTVKTLKLSTEARFDQSFLDCSRDALRSMRFKPGQMETTVRYPINFSPAE